MGGPAILRKTRHKLRAVSHQVDQRNDNLSTDTSQHDEHNHAPRGFLILTSLPLDETPVNHTNFDDIDDNQLYNNVKILLSSNKKSTMATRRPKYRRENFDVSDPTGKTSGAGTNNHRRYRRTKKRQGFVFITGFSTHHPGLYKLSAMHKRHFRQVQPSACDITCWMGFRLAHLATRIRLVYLKDTIRRYIGDQSID